MSTLSRRTWRLRSRRVLNALCVSRKVTEDEGPLLSLWGFPPCLGHKYLHPWHGSGFLVRAFMNLLPARQRGFFSTPLPLWAVYGFPFCTTVRGDSVRCPCCDRFVHAMVACLRWASDRRFNIRNGTAERLAHGRSTGDLFH